MLGCGNMHVLPIVHTLLCALPLGAVDDCWAGNRNPLITRLQPFVMTVLARLIFKDIEGSRICFVTNDLSKKTVIPSSNVPTTQGDLFGREAAGDLVETYPLIDIPIEDAPD